jgi:hypothetical protein
MSVLLNLNFLPMFSKINPEVACIISGLNWSEWVKNPNVLDCE